MWEKYSTYTSMCAETWKAHRPVATQIKIVGHVIWTVHVWQQTQKAGKMYMNSFLLYTTRLHSGHKTRQATKYVIQHW